MKFKLLALTALSMVSLSYSQEKYDEVVIPNASYSIFEGSNNSYAVQTGCKKVRFYTFDGNLLCECEHHLNFNIAKSKLDKNAPKPRPVHYKIEYRNTFKSPAGYWIVFYDKNGNNIAQYRCSQDSAPQTFGAELDLSIITKKN